MKVILSIVVSMFCMLTTSALWGQSTCVFTAPYSENFDGNTWISGFAPNNLGHQIDTCWSIPGGPSYFTYNFSPISGPTGSSPSTGPLADVSGTGKYIFIESSGLQDTGEINSPLIYIPATLANPHLRFYYHMAGVHIDSLVVLADSGNGFEAIHRIVGEKQFNQQTPWLISTANLVGYSGDTMQFKFKGYYRGFTADIALDEVSVDNVACKEPTGLEITNRTLSSLQLNWTTGGAANWQVEYGPAGFTLGGGFRLNASSSSIIINGLSHSNTYDFYVRDSCGAGSVGYWSAPVRGGTLCDTVIVAPWRENFDGQPWQSGLGIYNAGNVISNCWERPSIYDGHFGTHTGPTGVNGTGPNMDVSGSGNYIYSAGDHFQAVTGQITTPPLYIPDAMYNPQLKFNYHMYGGDIQNFRIRIDTGTGFLPASYVLLSQQQTSSGSAWEVDSINLNDFLGDTIQIRFIGQSNGNSGDIAIDELSILSDSSIYCAAPDSLIVSNIDVFEATFSWQSVQATSDVELLLKGQTPGSGQHFSSISSPYTFTGLIPDTTYIVRLQDSCKANAISLWESDTFKTQPCPLVSLGFTHSINLLNISFDASSSINADSLFWDFGDGTSDTGSFSQHAFAAKGTYIITLRGFSVCDSMFVLTDTIRVCDSLPDAQWTYGIVSTTGSGMLVQFKYTGHKSPTNYYWSFGDGGSASGTATPTHTYATPSLTYQVTLITTNECGDSTVLSTTLQSQVGLDEAPSRQSIEMWPNPTSGKIWVSWDVNELRVQDIAVYSMDGREIEVPVDIDGKVGRLEIDTGFLSSGTYFLQIRNTDGYVLKNVMVK